MKLASMYPRLVTIRFYHLNKVRLLILTWILAGSSALSRGEGTIEQPVPLKTVAPVPPADFKRAAVSQVITLGFWVDANGVVQNPKVIRTSDWVLARPALDAIVQWNFKRAQRDGVAVGTWANMAFKFAFAGDKTVEESRHAAK